MTVPDFIDLLIQNDVFFSLFSNLFNVKEAIFFIKLAAFLHSQTVLGYVTRKMAMARIENIKDSFFVPLPMAKIMSKY